MKYKYARYRRKIQEHMDVWGYKTIIFSLMSGLVIVFFYLKIDKYIATALIAVFYLPLGNWLLKKWDKMEKSRVHPPPKIK